MPIRFSYTGASHMGGPEHLQEAAHARLAAGESDHRGVDQRHQLRVPSLDRGGFRVVAERLYK